MNTRYKDCPELIGTVRLIDGDGEEKYLGDKVVGIQVNDDHDGLVQIDVRSFKGNDNFVIEIELPELVAALSLATYNANKTD